jgi:AmmeMemoRadiSam system protein B
MASAPTSAVRPSAIAGTWYPGQAGVLRQTIEGWLDQVTPQRLPGLVVSLVAPHAGYSYSGPIAAHAYAQVRGAVYHRVILMGPLHRPIWGSTLGPFMVPAESAYATPLGDVEVDRTFLARVGERLPLTQVRRDQEHSLEIQLPFLQVALAGPFQVLPIMFGEHIGDRGALERLETLAGVLADLVTEAERRGGEHTLLVASTDLSHLQNYDDVVKIDGELRDLVAAFDVRGLAGALAEERVNACGATGLVTALDAARRLGARGVQVLAYATSGDVTGDRRPGTYTVGYMAAAAYR